MFVQPSPHTTASRHCATPGAIFLAICLALAGCGVVDPERIRPYTDNPFYWQYDGEPILPLGGSSVENVFQLHGTQLTRYLDRLQAVGGNYLRNVMSTKYPGDVRPFLRLENGKYDLDQWNDAYWERLDRFLRETRRRDMFVQIELWDAFHFAGDHWAQSPWNPRNNVNYSAEESGLPVAWQEPPYREDSPFVLTVSRLPFGDNRVVLPYQRRFVEKVMGVSLQYDHVLYQIQNENAAPHAWPEYWAAFLHDAAARAGTAVEVTDMRNPHHILDGTHLHVIDRPRLYTYFEISQNNHLTGQTHYDRIRRIRSLLRFQRSIRPINNIKIYGADGGPFGDDRDGIERFWRNVFAGAASARFHREDSGLGFSSTAQTHLTSMRMLTDAMWIFSTAPRNDLLAGRADDEAYLLAEPGRQYALFFTGEGDRRVQIDLSDAQGRLRIRWLDIGRNAWSREAALSGGGNTEITAPGQGRWAALITAAGFEKPSSSSVGQTAQSSNPAATTSPPGVSSGGGGSFDPLSVLLLTGSMGALWRIRRSKQRDDRIAL